MNTLAALFGLLAHSMGWHGSTSYSLDQPYNNTVSHYCTTCTVCPPCEDGECWIPNPNKKGRWIRCKTTKPQNKDKKGR